MQDIAFFCPAAGRAAANALCDSLGAGPNNFSVPLAITPGVSNPALATHFAGSGQMEDAVAEAMGVSVDPMIQVRPNDGKSFDQHLAESDPRLYRIVESL